jgi:hypothetical protein
MTTKTLSTSHSAISMMDNNHLAASAHHLMSLVPSCDSSQRILVYNQALTSLTQIYSNKALDHVQHWYEQHALPNLNLLIKRGLLKTFKDKSIRMSIGIVRRDETRNNRRTHADVFSLLLHFFFFISFEEERCQRTIESTWKDRVFVRQSTVRFYRTVLSSVSITSKTSRYIVTDLSACSLVRSNISFDST